MGFQGQRKRSSITVEAAFLMPLIIGIVVFVIYIGFYHYNMGTCIYVSYMKANKIVNGQEEFDYGQMLEHKAIAMELLQVEVTEEEGYVAVTALGSQKIPFVNQTLTIETCQKQIRLNQREFILRCKLFKNVLK